MKEFIIYTALRILLFLASLSLVFSVWALLADQVPVLWVVVIAFLVSGVASYYLLSGPRKAFARRVEERATRASAAFEERRAREDVDE